MKKFLSRISSVATEAETFPSNLIRREVNLMENSFQLNFDTFPLTFLSDKGFIQPSRTKQAKSDSKSQSFNLVHF